MKVSPRTRRKQDRAGDPLDGLVNMFDIGIVLAVGFLLASLASLNLTHLITKDGLSKTQPEAGQITASPGQPTAGVPTSEVTVIGEGVEIGRVYRLNDGRTIWVKNR
jgi:hypothetical protein